MLKTQIHSCLGFSLLQFFFFNVCGIFAEFPVVSTTCLFFGPSGQQKGRDTIWLIWPWDSFVFYVFRSVVCLSHKICHRKVRLEYKRVGGEFLKCPIPHLPENVGNFRNIFACQKIRISFWLKLF